MLTGCVHLRSWQMCLISAGLPILRETSTRCPSEADVFSFCSGIHQGPGFGVFLLCTQAFWVTGALCSCMALCLPPGRKQTSSLSRLVQLPLLGYRTHLLSATQSLGPASRSPHVQTSPRCFCSCSASSSVPTGFLSSPSFPHLRGLSSRGT